MDPEPAPKPSVHAAQFVAVPALAVLGFTLAITGLGIPLAAVLTDRPTHSSVTAKESYGSQGSYPISVSRTGESDR
ncbi:hypothetical protein [Synechococcus sp. UW179A]|uniref:hypothetical protein n=1 Tax=Synechococcus sp. UW179A TaxID=2575510 RepID=UPI000E0E9176|nr:hypothetical protein [Synechococcus sp. UW179A]